MNAHIKFILKTLLVIGIIIMFFIGFFGIRLLVQNFKQPWTNNPYLKYPYLTWGDNPNSSISISFETPIIINSTIVYGQTENMELGILSEIQNKHFHIHNFTNLKADTLYYYRISSSTYNYSFMNQNRTFKTAANTSKAFRFIAYGDFREGITGESTHSPIVNSFMSYNPDFVVSTGDIVHGVLIGEEWDRLFYDLKPLGIKGVPFMTCIGNHEFYEGDDLLLDRGNTYLKYFGSFPDLIWDYSFDYVNSHFTCLNITESDRTLNPAELIWLHNDLGNASINPNIEWKFVYFHAPMYSSGGHSSSPILINQIQPILETYNVDLVFVGHDHHYERIEIPDTNIIQIVTGGGGAELDIFLANNPWTVKKALCHHFCVFDVNGTTLNFQCVRLDGVVIDSFTIIK